ELAQQTAHEAEWLTHYLNLNIASLVGGMDIVSQLKDLKRGAAIIAGTPGRVRDHLTRGSLNAENIKCVVLDEGDLMLDMGFREELEAILNSLPEQANKWLFSATMPEEVKSLANNYLSKPLELSLVEEGEQHEDILHRVYMIPSGRHFEGLVNILIWEHPSRSLVFCHTKMESIDIAQKLQDAGFSAAALQGDMTQNERNAVLASFKSGSVPCLVATNVAARGLDVEGVSHVIQLGLPDDKETFVHRSGRTGRAGNEGINLILLSPVEAGKFKAMLRETKMKVEWLDVPDIHSIHAVQRDITEQNLLSAPVDDNFKECLEWADELLSRAEPKILVAKLLSYLIAKSSKGYSLNRELDKERERRSRKSGTSKINQAVNKKQARPKGVIVKLNSLNNNNAQVGRVLNALCRSLNVERSEIGAIRINDGYVTAELMPVALAKLEHEHAALERWGFYPAINNKGRVKHDGKAKAKNNNKKFRG
nr:DEAD/DEAH box helicase [Synergistaceae bacterium]